MKRKVLFKMMTILAIFAMSVITVEAKELETEQESETEQIEIKSSLLGEYLGFEELGQTIKTSGLDAGIKLELQDGLKDACHLNPEEQMLADSSGELGIQWNHIEKYWNLHAGTEIFDEINLKADLYGDTERLLLSCDPFYDGILGIKAGSLAEQYEDSGLQAFLTDFFELPEDFAVSDRDLVFYPDLESVLDSKVAFGGVKTKLQNKWEKLLNKALVEIDDVNDKECYQLSVDSSDLLDLCFPILNELIGLGIDISIVDCYEALGLVEDIIWNLNSYKSYLGNNIQFELVKKKGLLAEFSCNMMMQNEYYTYDSDGERHLNYDTINASCQMNILEPKDPLKNLSLLIKLYNAELNEKPVTICLTLQRELAENGSKTSVAAVIKEGTKIVYVGVPFICTFDAETGEFDADFTVTENGMEISHFSMDSIFANVVKGEGFTWNMEELTVTAEGETFPLLKGSMYMNTKPKENCGTEPVMMIGDASIGEIFTIISEVMMNYEKWENQCSRIYFEYRMGQR